MAALIAISNCDVLIRSEFCRHKDLKTVESDKISNAKSMQLIPATGYLTCFYLARTGVPLDLSPDVYTVVYLKDHSVGNSDVAGLVDK